MAKRFGTGALQLAGKPLGNLHLHLMVCEVKKCRSTWTPTTSMSVTKCPVCGSKRVTGMRASEYDAYCERFAKEEEEAHSSRKDAKRKRSYGR